MNAHSPDAPDVSATALGHGAVKLFSDHAGKPKPDLDDAFAVAAIAAEIVSGKRRGVTIVSTVEIMALAKLASAAFVVAAHAADLAKLSDGNFARDQILDALERVTSQGRAFSEAYPCE
ncbi:MAG TPA: hypothetical protein VGG48_14120 [Rhizomicrobium sp.]|jgi:hypothetical protein